MGSSHFTPPLMSGTRHYFVLRRRDNGKYVALDGFRRFRESSEPIGPLVKLATARSHRLRILTEQPHIGLIDFEQIEISAVVQRRTEEDATISGHLVALCSCGVNGAAWMEHFEKLLRSDDAARSMRYAIVFQNLPAKLAKTIAATTHIIVRGQSYALAGNTADLLAIRMFEDAKPVLIYDFEEKRALLQPLPFAKAAVRGLKRDDPNSTGLMDSW